MESYVERWVREQKEAKNGRRSEEEGRETERVEGHGITEGKKTRQRRKKVKGEQPGTVNTEESTEE